MTAPLGTDRFDLPNAGAANFGQRVRETLMTYLGKQGDTGNRGVTVKDLMDAGLIALRPGASLQHGAQTLPIVAGTAIQYTPDLTPPPAPANFTATPGVTSIVLQTDIAAYSAGRGHARTRVYGAKWTTGGYPVFSDTVQITDFQGTLGAYATDAATWWHLWAKWESVDGGLSAPAGGTNGIRIQTGQNVSSLLTALAGQITNSQLDGALTSRINLIDASGTGLVAKVADLQTALGSAGSAAQATIDAQNAAAAAANSATAAAAAKVDAVNASSAATTAQAAAIAAQSGAQTAQSSASTLATNAATSASNAATSATAAASSATGAAGSASSASTSASTAAGSASTAGGSATAAATSATNAATYATNSGNSATASESSKVAAVSARDAAIGSANAAATSASTATTQASNAGTSAGAASTSATTAATQAGNASTSATQAATSATNSAGSANSAALSATAAATSENNAGGSANAAATSASTATTQAGNASTSATAANTSATTASTQAGNASTSANQASTSATNAAGSANSASTSAGAAATSATNASNSASAAATSASTATTQANNAGSSATAANTSAVGAATSQSAASNSASNSATSATNAAGSATAAASSLNQLQATATGFDAAVAWNFDATTEGWTYSGANVSQTAGSLQVIATNVDPIIASPAISVTGAVSTLVRARVKRVAGSGWDGRVFYQTAGHGYDGNYQKAVLDATVTGQWRVIEWDMSDLTIGGADWTANTILSIRLDLGNTSSDQFLVDWVTVGRIAPLPYSALLTQESSVRASETGALSAQWTLKTDVAGLISGFGFASSANNAAPTSAFGVRANQFYVAPPSVAQSTAPTVNLFDGYVWLDTSITPNVTRYYSNGSWVTTPPALTFTIQTTPTTINGVAVPPGVYINAAYIQNGTIVNAMIGNAAIDDAKISNLSATKLTAGTIAVGEYIQSTSYTAGSGATPGTGWKIDGAGNLQVSNAIIYGTVYATAGVFGGNVTGQINGFTASSVASNANNALANADTAQATANTAVTNAATAQSTANLKLSKAGDSITGRINLTVADGLFAGTDLNNGVYLGSGGLVGKKAGVTTFAVDAAGNATFAGALSAATGTFAGALTAAAVDAVDTINITGNAVTTAKFASSNGYHRYWLGWYTGTVSDVYASIGSMLTKSGDEVLITCSYTTVPTINYGTMTAAPYFEVNGGVVWTGPSVDSSTLADNQVRIAQFRYVSGGGYISLGFGLTEYLSGDGDLYCSNLTFSAFTLRK